MASLVYAPAFPAAGSWFPVQSNALVLTACELIAMTPCCLQCTLRFAVPEGNQTVLEAREKEHRFITPTGGFAPSFGGLALTSGCPHQALQHPPHVDMYQSAITQEHMLSSVCGAAQGGHCMRLASMRARRTAW